MSGRPTPAAPPTSYQPPPPPRRSSKRRGLFIVIGIVLLALVAGGVFLAIRYAPLIDDARAVRVSANRLAAQARTLDAATLDRATVEQLRTDVAELDERLAPIRDVIDDDPIVDLLGSLPGIDSQLAAADALVSAAGSLVEVADLGLGLADRVVELREENDADPDVALLSGMVGIMATSTGEVERMDRLIEDAMARLDQIPSGAIGQIAEARDLIAEPLAEYGPILDAYRGMDEVLPGILGWGGQKRYLVMAQNPAELRATGGYNGTVGVVEMEEGAIAGLRFNDAHESGRTEGLPFVEGPDALVNHLLGEDQSWRLPDANWWADFPTSAQQALELYEIETGDGDFDGVIGITTDALDRLLEVVGPVRVEEFGITVHPGETTLVLLGATREGEDGGIAGRKKVLDVLAREVMRRLLRLPPEQWAPMLEAIEDIVREEMMLAWFPDSEAQELVTDAGLDGRVRQDPGDYLYVVESNVAPTSKYNLVIDRSRSFHVALDENGDAFSSVLLEWQNDAGKRGEPYRSLRQFSTDRDGYYGAHVRVLVPSGSELITANGVASEEVRGAESVDEESGRAVFANYLLMPPGESRLTYLWAASGAAVQTEDGWEYRLTLQRQPGARPEAVSVRIDLPEGATVTETSERAMVEGERVVFETTMTTDIDLRVLYELPT